MSYAALYTHIKQKHDGIAPGEIIRPLQVKENLVLAESTPSSEGLMVVEKMIGYLSFQFGEESVL